MEEEEEEVVEVKLKGHIQGIPVVEENLIAI